LYGLEQKVDLEEKQREIEEYQARTPRLPPLTAASLRKVRRAESDSDSQDSQTDSSGGSDLQTKYGSGAGSKVEDDSITMIIGGVKIDLPANSVDNRRINVRSGEEGSFELNIEGRKPRNYLLGRSDSTSASGRREMIEDVRRVREETRSERDSRRSSRSGYSGRGLLD
jgi:hypothetical protein